MRSDKPPRHAAITITIIITAITAITATRARSLHVAL
jgi:hypothetical protein